jgi:hypothetical protein
LDQSLSSVSKERLMLSGIFVLRRSLDFELKVWRGLVGFVGFVMKRR